MKKVELVAAMGFVAIVMLLSGCGSSAGWAVQFGVHPVTAVSNHQALNTTESNYVSKGDARGNSDK